MTEIDVLLITEVALFQASQSRLKGMASGIAGSRVLKALMDTSRRLGKRGAQ
jgi:uncharacterized RDD family membrane protein YckC